MTITLEPLQTQDLELLKTWLSLPEIQHSWGDPESNLREIQSFLGSDFGKAFLIQEDQNPIGYLQTYDCHLDPDPYWKEHVEKGTWGFDLFLLPEFQGKTRGTQAVQALIRILKKEKIAALLVDPQLRNPRAIHFYEKLGFQKIRELSDHPEGGNLLMRLDF